MRVLDGQSLVDMALQAGGSVEGVFALAALNGLGITADLVAGGVLQVPAEQSDARVVKYYARMQLQPATGLTGYEAQGRQGIEFWGVEYTFVVS